MCGFTEQYQGEVNDSEVVFNMNTASKSTQVF